MQYIKKDSVRMYDGKIGVIDDIIFTTINGKTTDQVDCYEMTINGVSGYLVHPDEIKERS